MKARKDLSEDFVSASSSRSFLSPFLAFLPVCGENIEAEKKGQDFTFTTFFSERLSYKTLNVKL